MNYGRNEEDYNGSRFNYSESSDNEISREINDEYGHRARFDTKKLMELEQIAEYHLNKGEIGEGFNLIKRSLDVYKKLYGPKSIEYKKIYDEIILKQNQRGLKEMNRGKLDVAYRVLKHVETLCALGHYTDNVNYKIIVYNHIGCCLRRLTKLGSALKYFINAMKLIKASGVKEEYPSTCLNLCAIYRQRGEHKKAIKMAKKACDEFSHQIITLNVEDFDDREDFEIKYAEKVKLLAISYHNLGVEQEFRGKKEKACSCFKKAYALMKDKFGDENLFTQKFKRNYELKVKKKEYEDIDFRRVKSLKKNRAGMVAYSQEIPEWKITNSPYDKKKLISKYHKKCAPNLLYSKSKPVLKIIRRPKSSRTKKIKLRKKKKKKKTYFSQNMDEFGNINIPLKVKDDEDDESDQRGSHMSENRNFVIKKMNNYLKSKRINNAKEESEKLLDKKREEARKKYQERQKEKDRLLKEKRRKEKLAKLMNERAAKLIQKKYLCHRESKNDGKNKIGFKLVLRKYFKVRKDNKKLGGKKNCYVTVMGKQGDLKFYLRTEKRPHKLEVLEWKEQSLRKIDDDLNLRMKQIQVSEDLLKNNLIFLKKFEWEKSMDIVDDVVEEKKKEKKIEKKKEVEEILEINFDQEEDDFGFSNEKKEEAKKEEDSFFNDDFEDPDNFNFFEEEDKKNPEISSKKSHQSSKSDFIIEKEVDLEDIKNQPEKEKSESEFNLEEEPSLGSIKSKPMNKDSKINSYHLLENISRKDSLKTPPPPSKRPPLPRGTSKKLDEEYIRMEKERQERIRELRKDPHLMSSVLTIQRYTRGGLERNRYLHLIRERMSYIIFFRVLKLNNLEVLVTFKENPTEFIVNCYGVRENKLFKEARASKDGYDCPEEVLQYMELQEDKLKILFYEKKINYDQKKIKRIQNWWQKVKMIKWLRLNISEDSMREKVGRILKLVKRRNGDSIIFEVICYYYRDQDKLEYRLMNKENKKLLDMMEIPTEEFDKETIIDIGGELLDKLEVEKNKLADKNSRNKPNSYKIKRFQKKTLDYFNKGKGYSEAIQAKEKEKIDFEQKDFKEEEKEIYEKEEIISDTIFRIKNKTFTLNIYRIQEKKILLIESKGQYSPDEIRTLEIKYELVNLKQEIPIQNVKRHIDEVILSSLEISSLNKKLSFLKKPWHRNFDWMGGFDLDSFDLSDNEFNLTHTQLDQLVKGNKTISELDKDEIAAFDSMEDKDFKIENSIEEDAIGENLESQEIEELEKSIESQQYEEESSAWKKIAGKIVQKKMSWSQLFRMYDKVGDSSLGVIQIKDAFVNELGVSLKDAITVAKDIDEDLNGTVTLEEWMEKFTKFMDNVDEIKNVVITYEEFKDILYVRLLNGELIWESLFLENNPNKESLNVMSLSDKLQWRLDLPKKHLFDFIKNIDMNRNGFVSYKEWIDAYNCPAFSNDKHRFLLKLDEEEYGKKPLEIEYVFDKAHFQFESSLGDLNLNRSEVSGLSDIAEEEDTIGGEGRRVEIIQEHKEFEDDSLHFKEFLKLRKGKFKPDNFFKNLIVREKENKVPVAKITNEIFGEYPEVKRNNFVKLCREKDKEQTGFMSIQIWREICGEEPSPFNFIKDQKFDLKGFKERCKTSTKSLLETFKGFNDVLAMVFMENDDDSDNIVPICSLANSLNQIVPEISSKTIFEALCTMTCFKSVFINFHEFSVSLDLSNRDINEHKEYIKLDNINTPKNNIDEKLKRLKNLKNELTAKNFDFKDAFQRSILKADPTRAKALQLVASMKNCLGEDSKNLGNLMNLIKSLDGMKSGFVEHYAWEYFFSPVVRNSSYSLNKNFEPWSELALNNLKIEIGTSLRTVYDYFKASSKKSELNVKKFELSFLALKKFIDVYKVVNDDVVDGFLKLL